MKTKKLIGTLAITTLVATSFVFAQEITTTMQGSVDATGTMPPPPPRPGMMEKARNAVMGERKEIRQEYREERKEIMGEFREDMKERHDYMKGSSTPGMATPTPWKNMRDNMKDLRIDMRGKVASITEAQMSAISSKLGITVDALKAQLASGTPLRQIIGDKISKEDMMQIIPPMLASSTASGSMMMEKRDRPRGFFNSFRERFFGKPVEATSPENSGTEMTGEVVVENENQVRPGFGNFFKRLFNW